MQRRMVNQVIRIEYLDSNPLIEKVEAFNNKLNSYDYGLVYNGTKMVQVPERQEDFNKILDEYWRLQDSETIDKYEVAICYDMVRREADWFENECSYPTRTTAYYCEFASGETHTWLIFTDRLFDDSIPTYIFESAWQKYQGVYQVDRDNLLNFYVNHISSENSPNNKYVLFMYEPLSDELGITIDEFKYNRWKNDHLYWTNCDSYEDLLNTFGLKGREKELDLERLKRRFH